MATCFRCGAALSFNRGSTRFLCKPCLAQELNISVEAIDRKIEQFKAQGCTLFI